MALVRGGPCERSAAPLDSGHARAVSARAQPSGGLPGGRVPTGLPGTHPIELTRMLSLPPPPSHPPPHPTPSLLSLPSFAEFVRLPYLPEQFTRDSGSGLPCASGGCNRRGRAGSGRARGRPGARACGQPTGSHSAPPPTCCCAKSIFNETRACRREHPAALYLWLCHRHEVRCLPALLAS